MIQLTIARKSLINQTKTTVSYYDHMSDFWLVLNNDFTQGASQPMAARFKKPDLFDLLQKSIRDLTQRFQLKIGPLIFIKDRWNASCWLLPRKNKSRICDLCCSLARTPPPNFLARTHTHPRAQTHTHTATLTLTRTQTAITPTFSESERERESDHGLLSLLVCQWDCEQV